MLQRKYLSTNTTLRQRRARANSNIIKTQSAAKKLILPYCTHASARTCVTVHIYICDVHGAVKTVLLRRSLYSCRSDFLIFSYIYTSQLLYTQYLSTMYCVAVGDAYVYTHARERVKNFLVALAFANGKEARARGLRKFGSEQRFRDKFFYG